MRLLSWIAPSACCVLFLTARITPVCGGTLDLYHLGEADPGAVAGNTGDNPTIDSGPGGNNLPSSGSPTYSSNVGAPGSTLSMAFNGTTDDYMLGHALTTLTTNVGISSLNLSLDLEQRDCGHRI